MDGVLSACQGIEIRSTLGADITTLGPAWPDTATESVPPNAEARAASYVTSPSTAPRSLTGSFLTDSFLLPALLCGTGLPCPPGHRDPPTRGDGAARWLGSLAHPREAGTIRDLRRSAGRNLVSASVDQVTARRISEHKIASAYQRYRIVDVDDTAAALAKTADAVRRQPVSNVHVRHAGAKLAADGIGTCLGRSRFGT